MFEMFGELVCKKKSGKYYSDFPKSPHKLKPRKAEHERLVHFLLPKKLRTYPIGYLLDLWSEPEKGISVWT
jgi:hypothetical protein